MNRILHIKNAKIYTMDNKQPLVTSMLIHNGKIIACGTAEQLAAICENGNAERMDLDGMTVLPALQDAHIHLEILGLGLMKVNCETPTKNACLQRIAEQAAVTPAGEWILGHGWNQNEWQDVGSHTSFPTAAELDAIAPNHPVYCTAKSLHAGWANSLAMQEAGITEQTENPQRGEIVRDAQGLPTGILLEEAMQLIEEKIPKPSLKTLEQAIMKAQQYLLELGVGSVHDFDGVSCFAALQSLHKEGKLKIRVTKGMPLEQFPYATKLGLSCGFGDEMLRIGPLKVFMDGALGPRTASMLKSYNGEADNLGKLFMTSEELFDISRKAVDHGFNIAVHAIGDRANREALDAFERLREYEKANQLPHLRHRIEHVQLLHPQDVPRLGKLGLVASMQPFHVISDMEPADRFWGERAVTAYAWKSQIKNGAVCAFGSDAPVENPNPFWGIHAAVTRRRWDGYPAAEGWHPQEKLSLVEALWAYTYGTAYAAGNENKVGKLQADYFADLIVLKTDPFICEQEELKDIKPVATMINGEWVWKR